MPLLDWLRPPRHLLVLFLLVTLVPSSLFIVFGWRSMEQDQTLERQRSGERIQQTADLVVSTLDQELSVVRQSLPTPATLPGLDEGADSAVVQFSAESVETYPNQRLAWYPVVPPGNEASPQRFAEAEELEIVRKDYPAAIQVLRELARSPEAAVRAGALIRLARNLVKNGQPDAALAAYQDAAASGQDTVAGVPSDLLARWARCALLEQLQRTGQLREEARALYGELLQGRFRLARPAYEMHRSDIRRWADKADLASQSNAHLLAETVEWLWSEWKQGRTPNRTTFATGGIRFTVLSQGSLGNWTALVAGPRYVERHWLAKLDALTRRQNLKVLIEGESRGAGQWAARRAATQTGLPWTLTFEDTGREAETARMAARRRLWLAGLCLLAGLVIAGTYFIARAMTRELALARLQSDFVSSVSHEFRTPLTSLSQLVEILMERASSPKSAAPPTTRQWHGKPIVCGVWWKACSISAAWRPVNRRTACNCSMPARSSVPLWINSDRRPRALAIVSNWNWTGMRPLSPAIATHSPTCCGTCWITP